MTSRSGLCSSLHGAANPYRAEVLLWYRRCLRAAFTVPWASNQDALYVLDESRRLFHQNSNITDAAVIERKLREVEMRYGLAMHYKIPYPRLYHKVQGSTQESAICYSAYLDSSYDHLPSPHTGHIQQGSTNCGMVGSTDSPLSYYEDSLGIAEVEGRLHALDTVVEPASTLQNK